MYLWELIFLFLSMLNTSLALFKSVRNKGGNNADASNNIKSGEDFTYVSLRRQVAIADRRQGDNAEIVSINPGEFLHKVKNCCAQPNGKHS